MSETTQEDSTEQQGSLDDIHHYLEQRCIQLQKQNQKNKEIKGYLDSFSSLLEQLYTEESRATAVLLVQQKQDSISKEYIDKAIRTYETQKKFDTLAQLAKNAGIAEHLLATYGHRGNVEQEAVLAKHLGLEDKARMLYKRAILRHMQGGSYDVAGSLAQDAGLEEHAQKLFILGRKKEKQISKKTIEFYEWFLHHDADISSIVDRIIEVLEYTGRFEQGAEIAEKHNLLHKALENYERAGQWARAGTSAEQALYLEKEFCHNEQYELLFEKAILNYRKAGWIDHAANIALREGKKERAILIYEENHQLNKASTLVKEIGLQRTLMFYEKAGCYKDAMEAVKNTEFSSRESLYNALLTLSSSSFEVSLPELPLVPQKKYTVQKKPEEKKELSEEEQFLMRLPRLTLKPLTLGDGELVQLPPDDTTYSFPPYRQEDPSSWFFSRVGVNIVSSLTTDAIKKYLPVLLAVVGISGSSYFAAHQGQNGEKTMASVSVSLNSDCPPKETLEGKFCRTSQWDHVLTRAEKYNGLPEGLLAGLAMAESYGNPLALNIQNDGSAGIFQLEPEIAKKYGLVVYDEQHARTGNSSYGKALRKFIEEKEYAPSQLQQYDDRFDVEKSATVAAEYLHDLSCAFKKQQRKDNHLASHDTMALAVASYKEGKERAHSAVHDHDAYLLKVREYQEYYLKRKKE